MRVLASLLKGHNCYSHVVSVLSDYCNKHTNCGTVKYQTLLPHN
jgi:hypothetical protein